MTIEERKDLRDFYQKEYEIKTGHKLFCIEKTAAKIRYKKTVKENIIEITAEYLNVPAAFIMEKRRKKEQIKARELMIAFLKEYKLTDEEIATHFVHWDRTSITHAVGSIAGYKDVDEEWCELYIEYRDYCRTRIEEIHKAKEGRRVSVKLADIPTIRELFNSGLSQTEIAKRYELSISTIHRIVRGKYWGL